MNKKESGIISDSPEDRVVSEIQSHIEAVEKNASLYEEKNFNDRTEAIDFMGFGIIERIESLLQKTAHPALLNLLKCRAERVLSELEQIDSSLFQKIQENIRIGKCRGEKLKDLVKEYVDLKFNDEPGYDNLDIFINGLSSTHTMPEQTKELEPEMVYYQKTPARIVFEMVDKVHFMKDDVFYDLGSGLGQVAILINLLTGITAKGVEFEPAFCDYAGDCATGLNLSNVTFINVDARKADYSDGTVFFMFTPFRGEIMQEVLAVLKKESLFKKIKVITYGPCTAIVALQNWLKLTSPATDNIYQLGIFTSL